MISFYKDLHGRYVFAEFPEIAIIANTPGEAWAKLLQLGKYFSVDAP